MLALTQRGLRGAGVLVALLVALEASSTASYDIADGDNGLAPLHVHRLADLGRWF